MGVSRRPRGFALMVAVVLIAVFAVMATVITISLSGDNDQARIEAVADELHRIASALDSGANANYDADMPKFPANLSTLTHRISANDLTCSGTKYAGGDVTKWNGPYYTVPISPNGHYLGPGFVASNTLLYPSATILSIQIPDVSLNDANLLDIQVDGTSDLANGIVRYSSTGPSIGVVSYRLTIVKC